MPVRGRLPDVRKAHEHLLEQGAAPVGVREVVADSWLRSVAAGVDADTGRFPITLCDVDITGGRDVDAPQTIAMVRAAARMAESELAHRAHVSC